MYIVMINKAIKSSKLWSPQLRTQFKQLRIEAWKSQDFNGVWAHDLAIPVRRSNQPSYEATGLGSWSFVSSNEPVKNGCEVIYEMFSYIELRIWNQVSYDHRLLDFKSAVKYMKTFHISLTKLSSVLRFSLFSLRYFLKEIENIFFVFL